MRVARNARGLHLYGPQTDAGKKSFEFGSGGFAIVDDKPHRRVGWRLRDQPVKVRRVLRLEPYLRGAGPRTSRQFHDRLQQRRRVMTVARRGPCHAARHAVRADQGFAFKFLHSASVGIADGHRRAAGAGLEIDQFASAPDFDSRVDGFAREHAHHRRALDDQIRFRHGDGHRPGG